MANTLKKQGEKVSIEFTSADASGGAVAVTLKDAQYLTRVLASFERLVIDTLDASMAAAAGPVDVYADLNGNNAVDANELCISLGGASSTNAEWADPDEGLNVPTGFTPKVKAAAAGAVKVTGTGRIVAQTPTGRMPWNNKPA